MHQMNVFANNSRSEMLCILIYEQSDSSLVKFIFEQFEGSLNTKIVPAALPVNIIECVREGADELLIVAHSAELGHQKDKASLVFSLPVTLSEQKKRISEEEIRLLSQLEELEWSPRNGYIDTHQFDFYTEGKKSQALKINTLVKNYFDLIQFKEDKRTIYDYDTFDSQIFNLIYKELVQQKKSENGIKLKKIRLLTCQPKKVLKRYPILNQIISQFDISLDYPLKKGAFEIYGSVLTGFRDVKYMFNKKWYHTSYRSH